MNIRSALSDTKIDFMRLNKLCLTLSIFFMTLSLVLVFTKGLNFGIDFAGGILIEVRINDNYEISQVRELLSAQIKDVQIQNIGEKDLLIRLSKTDENQQAVISEIQQILGQKFSNIEYRKIDYVGPQVGAELILKGLMALLLSLFLS